MITAETRSVVPPSNAYRERMFDLVGQRNPLEVLAQTASTLSAIVNKHSATVLRARPFEGKWTPNEIIGHLTDSEWVYGYRLRLILCEDNPTILGTVQDSWVAGLRHNEREPSEHLEIFRTLRLLNLEVWNRMSPADLERCGQHNERGAESLEVMLRLLAGHDLSHLGQLTRYIQAVQKPEPSLPTQK
ncbi:MAG TPA: DinB family protein [Terriglobales bacterium]|nr:DinB family protein [Terriglobales bacterium]